MLLLNSRDRRLMKESEEYLLFEKNPLDEEGNEEEETEEDDKHEDDPVVQQLRYRNDNCFLVCQQKIKKILL